MTGTVLVDYGCGNIRSAERALILAGDGAPVVVSADPDVIGEAERLVLPGVGHFVDCMVGLSARNGLLEALSDRVLKDAVPFLGICVGMQMLADKGFEDGETSGLGWIGGQVEHLPKAVDLPIPHMGWNALLPARTHPLLTHLGADSYMYFVHSYAITGMETNHVLATTDYGAAFPSIIGRDNIVGTQFHPEKSAGAGRQLLENFLKWRP